jgi:hypothetical protein
MSGDQGGDHVGGQLHRHDRLDAELRHPLLGAALADCRIGELTRNKRAGALGVPRAPFVVADPSGARPEDRVARGVERLRGHEPDELVRRGGHVCGP